MAGNEKDLRKGGRGQERRGTMVNFGTKIDAGLKEGQAINWGGGLRQTLE